MPAPKKPFRKKPDNSGQQWMDEVQQAVNASYKGRFKGMPSLDVIQTEALRMGLTKEDGQYIYDKWMLNGFTQGRTKIKSWKHAMSYWYNSGWFPSQKGIMPSSELQTYPSYERVEAWCKKKKMSPLIKRAWGELMTGKFRGRPITNQTDFESALEVILAQWMKEP